MLFHGLVILMVITACRSASVPNPHQLGDCSCGIFKDSTPDKTSSAPLAPQVLESPFVCGKRENERCANECNKYSDFMAPQAEETICKLIKNTDGPIKLKLFYKVCKSTEWVFANNLKTPTVCCKDMKPCK